MNKSISVEFYHYSHMKKTLQNKSSGTGTHHKVNDVLNTFSQYVFINTKQFYKTIFFAIKKIN